MYDFSSCTLCPRRCRANRKTSFGFCGVNEHIKIARAALHCWEEPPISGTKGSGTIFFSGCALGCVFCQNKEISKDGFGMEITKERLQDICFELKEQGAHNINLVTPMHYACQVREALLPIKKELGLPIVVNTGGYDSKEQIDCFKGVADIYLPDYKFYNEETGRALAHAPNYREVARAALLQMFEQVGKPQFDENGILQSGMIVRHLILPGYRKESIEILEDLHSMFTTEDFLLSVMSQYCPIENMEGSLKRQITTFERDSVLKKAEELGFHGFFQDRSSASSKYIPDFSLQGVLYAKK